MKVDIDQLVVPQKRLRAWDPVSINSLYLSMEDKGQLTPLVVSVKRHTEVFTIQEGHARFIVAIMLGWDTMEIITP